MLWLIPFDEGGGGGEEEEEEEKKRTHTHTHSNKHRQLKYLSSCVSVLTTKSLGPPPPGPGSHHPLQSSPQWHEQSMFTSSPRPCQHTRFCLSLCLSVSVSVCLSVSFFLSPGSEVYVLTDWTLESKLCVCVYVCRQTFENLYFTNTEDHARTYSRTNAHTHSCVTRTHAHTNTCAYAL